MLSKFVQDAFRGMRRGIRLWFEDKLELKCMMRNFWSAEDVPLQKSINPTAISLFDETAMDIQFLISQRQTNLHARNFLCVHNHDLRRTANRALAQNICRCVGIIQHLRRPNCRLKRRQQKRLHPALNQSAIDFSRDWTSLFKGTT